MESNSTVGHFLFGIVAFILGCYGASVIFDAFMNGYYYSDRHKVTYQAGTAEFNFAVLSAVTGTLLPFILCVLCLRKAWKLFQSSV